MPISLSPSVMFDLLVAVLNRELRSSLRRCEANGIELKKQRGLFILIVLEHLYISNHQMHSQHIEKIASIVDIYYVLIFSDI